MVIEFPAIYHDAVSIAIGLDATHQQLLFIVVKGIEFAAIMQVPASIDQYHHRMVQMQAPCQREFHRQYHLTSLSC
jgi:hypothetical protein